MKGLTKSWTAAVFCGLLLLPALSEAGTRIYLRIGPPRARTVLVKPAKPYRHATWVAGHWRYSRNRYVWVNGVWLKQRTGYIYIQPHWKNTHRGYILLPGRWKKI